MKTKRRIIFFIALTIIVSFFGFSQVVSFYLADFVKERAFVVAEEASEQQSELVRKEVEGSVNLSLFLRTAVKNILVDGSKNPEQLNRLLAETLKQSPHLFGTWVVWEEDLLKNGNPIYTSYWHFKKGETMKDKRFYNRSKDKAYPVLRQATKTMIIPHFFYDPSSLFSSQLISFSSPIIIDGKYMGAVGVDIEIDKLRELIESIDIISFGYASLLNEDFKFVAHNNAHMISRSLYDDMEEEELEAIKEKLFKDEKYKAEHISLTMPDREYRIYTSLHLAGTEQTWYFVVNVPMDKIMQPAETINNYTLMASVFVIIVILIIINFVISYVVDPIVKMARMLGELASGRPVTEEIKISFRDEIGEMNHNFVKLVKALEEKDKAERALFRAKETAEGAKYKLQTLNRELENRVGQRTASLAREIEERKSTQVALQESEASYKNLVRNSFQGLIIYDAKSILFVNQRLLEIFDRTEEELLRMSIDEFYRLHHPEEAHIIHNKLDLLERNPNFTDQYVYRILKKNGSIRWVEDYSTSINYKGKPAVQVVLLDVHERRIVEKDLAEYRKFLKRIIDNNPNLIFVKDIEHRYVLANKAMADLYDLSVDEMIGKTDTDLCIEEETVNEFITYEKQAAESLLPQSLPVTTFNTGEGEDVYFQAVKIPLLSGNGVCENVLTVVTDITTRLKAEEKAKGSEAAIRQILDTIHDAIILHDKDLNIVDTNSKVESVFGISKAEALKMKLTDLAPPRMSFARIAKVFRNLHFDEPRFFEMRGMKPKTRELFDVEVYISKVNLFGGPHYLSAIRDITERKQFETALESAKREAESANKSKGEFLTNMSHEIRTPMNAIIGFTELLEKTDTTTKQKHFLESIKSGGQSLINVINDILDLSRIEAGKLELKLEPTNPGVLFTEIKHIFRSKYEGKELDFILDVDPDMPNTLILDEVRLRQVVLNLVGNAIKFTDSGFVKLVANRITIPNNKTKINLEISVQDSGIGIPEHLIDQIFESFSHRDSENEQKYGGTGLGLSISKRLVSLMGGEIGVTSDVDTGSIFNFTLYGVTLSTEKANNESSASTMAGQITFEPATVLVVDDVKTNRDFILESLRHAPLKLVAAANGREAVEMAQNYLPDVILLDIRMPIMDGYQAVEAIKEQQETKHSKVVAMTSSVFGQEMRKIEAYRFDDFLRKPIHLQELYETLAKYLPHKRMHTKESFDELASSSFIQPQEINSIITEFESVVVPLWNEACENEMSDDIENFKNAVLQLAKHSKILILEEYGKKLQSELESFDLEKMSESLMAFSQIVDQVKQES